MFTWGTALRLFWYIALVQYHTGLLRTIGRVRDSQCSALCWTSISWSYFGCSAQQQLGQHLQVLVSADIKCLHHQIPTHFLFSLVFSVNDLHRPSLEYVQISKVDFGVEDFLIDWIFVIICILFCCICCVFMCGGRAGGQMIDRQIDKLDGWRWVGGQLMCGERGGRHIAGSSSAVQGQRAVNPSVRTQKQIYEGILYGCEVVFLALSGHTGLPQTDGCWQWLAAIWVAVNEETVEHILCLISLFGMSETWSSQCVVSARWAPGIWGHLSIR